MPIGAWIKKKYRESHTNPGWGDWRRSLGLLLFLGLFMGKLKLVRFAFLATGLDAVQRLEQKKIGVDLLGQ